MTLLALWLVSALAAGLPHSPAAAGPAAGPVAVAPAGVGAAATDGLRQEVAYSYEVDPEDVVTRVTARASLTHTRPDSVDGSWYFDYYAFPVPVEATGLWGSVGGSPVTVSTETSPELEGTQVASLELSPHLTYGQTREVAIGYELGPQADRDDVWSQANEAAFMFPVWAYGDPGLASVEVRIPADYEVSVMKEDLDRTDLDDEILLSAYNIEDPIGFTPIVLAIDETRATTQTAETSVGMVELVAWPGHTEWVSFVLEHVDEGVPVLSDLIGQPWPYDEDRPLTIVETLEVVAEGFGGWYDSAEHKITIGDQLDSHLVLHELAHVWVNFSVFKERWLVEGFAEEYAHRAVDTLGTDGEPRPTEGDLADRPVQLSQWTTPLVRDEASQQSEEYGYAASAFVIGEIAEEIGLEALQDVFAAAQGGEITYVGGPEPEQLGQPVGWRQVLDLLENKGSEQADELFTTYVLTQSQQGELDDRAAARGDYLALADRGGDWAPPLGVRAGMAAWDFDSALAAMDDAEAVLDVRDDLELVLAGLDVGRLGLQADYESAEDVGVLHAEAETTLAAAEAYREAAQSEQSGGVLSAVGRWGAKSADDRLEAARLALAEGDPAEALRQSEAAAAALDGAARAGMVRLAVVGAVLGGGVLLVRWTRRRRRGRAVALARWTAPSGSAGPPATETPDRSGADRSRSGDVIAAGRRMAKSRPPGAAPEWVSGAGGGRPGARGEP